MKFKHYLNTLSQKHLSYKQHAIQKKVLLAITIFSCFAFAKCNKVRNAPPPDNPYGLPNATQTGANIFACRVNGENWISKKSIYNMGGGIDGDRIWINGSNPPNTSFYERFDININQFHQYINIYQLNDTLNQFARFSTNKSCFSIAVGYGTGKSKSYEGEIIFTKVDKTKKNLSGNFWFNIKTDYCDTLKITDGRFDIRYY